MLHLDILLIIVFFCFVGWVILNQVYTFFFRSSKQGRLLEWFWYWWYWWNPWTQKRAIWSNIELFPIYNVYTQSILGHKIIYSFLENYRLNIRKQIIISENKSSIERIISKVAHIILATTVLVWIILQLALFLWNIELFGISEKWMQYPIVISIISLTILISFLLSRTGVLYRNLWKQSMESLWFEKSFDAFSRDPIEARMIITPALMDRLEEFSNKWDLHGKIRIIWENDTFTLLLKWDIEKYGKESDGSYTLVKSMEEILNLEYYSLTNTNNI